MTVVDDVPAGPRTGTDTGVQPVLVLGEALVDVFPDGSHVPGGAPFNVARWLAAFGIPAVLVTRLGSDDAGTRAVLASARRCGLAEAGLQRDPLRPTGRVRVALDASGLGANGPTYDIEPDSAWDHIDTSSARAVARALQPALVVFGTLAQRHPTSREAVHATLGAVSALRLADLNLRPMSGLREHAERTLALADWIKVNDEELEQLLAWFVPGPPTSGPAREQALRSLVRRFGIQRVIVTCGPRGWYALDAEGRRDHAGLAPAVPTLVDTVGAGDAFCAVVAAGHALGWPLARALPAAARLASALCGRRGALPDDDAFIDHWRTELGFPLPARRTLAGTIGCTSPT